MRFIPVDAVNLGQSRRKGGLKKVPARGGGRLGPGRYPMNGKTRGRGGPLSTNLAREAFGASKPRADINRYRNFLWAPARCTLCLRGSAAMTVRTLVLMPVLERGPGALAVNRLEAVALKRGSTPL